MCLDGNGDTDELLEFQNTVQSKDDDMYQCFYFAPIVLARWLIVEFINCSKLIYHYTPSIDDIQKLLLDAHYERNICDNSQNHGT